LAEQRFRVEADQHGKRATFADIEVGRSLGELEWTLTKDMIDTQCEMDLDFHPWFFLNSPWGGRVAPPQLTYRPPRWLLSRTFNVRGLFVGWEMENVKPIKPGVVLRVRGSIVDKYVKNEREFVIFQAEGVDPQGEVVFRTRRTHILDVIERWAPRHGEGVDSGIKSERI
jgi:acyl dehydratase